MEKLYWKDLKTYLGEWIFYSIYKNKKRVFQKRSNAINKNIEEAIDFTLRNVQYIISFLPNKDSNYLKNKKLLEIGPGQDFGIAFILIDLGLSEAILIDPYLIEWKAHYHPLYYESLLQEVQKKYPLVEFSSLKEIIRNQSHDASKLRCYNLGIEKVFEVEDGTIDISISNACFEHFVYPELAVKELARITKKGGIGFHQIDLRDHRNYNKPLEFLTFPDKLFLKIKKMTDARFGNRLRYNEYKEIFEEAGFLVEFKVDSFADEAYLNTILKKALPKYRQMPTDFVGMLGGRFFIQKIS